MSNPRTSLIGVLFFSCVILAACQPPPVLSYPYLWDDARTKPKDSDVVGTFRLHKARLPSNLEGLVNEKPSRLTLKGDHTALFADVPEFDDFGDALVCRLSGSASWDLYRRREWGWIIVFRSYHPAMPSTTECGHTDGVWEGFQVLNRYAPYRLYMIVGDPDSDTGLEFERESN